MRGTLNPSGYIGLAAATVAGMLYAPGCEKNGVHDVLHSPLDVEVTTSVKHGLGTPKDTLKRCSTLVENNEYDKLDTIFFTGRLDELPEAMTRQYDNAKLESELQGIKRSFQKVTEYIKTPRGKADILEDIKDWIEKGKVVDEKDGSAGAYSSKGSIDFRLAKDRKGEWRIIPKL